MKKIIYIFLDLLTIAFLIGGYAFQYFTRKKLGMLRWVNYQNMQLQKNPVYDILKYITVAAAVVLIVLSIVGYRKKKELLGKTDFVMIVIMQILGISYLGITSVEIYRIVSGILLFNAASWGSDTDADYQKWNCSGDKKE